MPAKKSAKSRGGSGKIAIVLISDWDQKLKVTSALHLAHRIYEAKQENSVDALEVFLFSGGAKLLESLPEEFVTIMKQLKQSGITVKVCTTEAKLWKLEENAEKLGIETELARDAFSRYAREGFTVYTF